MYTVESVHTLMSLLLHFFFFFWTKLMSYWTLATFIVVHSWVNVFTAVRWTKKRKKKQEQNNQPNHTSTLTNSSIESALKMKVKVTALPSSSSSSCAIILRCKYDSKAKNWCEYAQNNAKRNIDAWRDSYVDFELMSIYVLFSIFATLFAICVCVFFFSVSLFIIIRLLWCHTSDKI